MDTHLDLHVAVALDQLGRRRLGELTVPTSAKGYESLLCWAESFGPIRHASVEGTGSYGAGLTRHLRSAGIAVFEVESSKPRHLRRSGKSDSRDAGAAARAVLAGEPKKSADGRVETIRALKEARRSAVKLGDKLSKEEMEALVKEWLSSRYPATCPHGRSICYRMDHKEIARKLDRH